MARVVWAACLLVGIISGVSIGEVVFQDGFENGLDTSVWEWPFSNWGGTKQIVTTNPYAGNKALYMAGSDTGPGGASYMQTKQIFSLVRGQVDLYFRDITQLAGNGNDGHVGIDLYSSTNEFIGMYRDRRNGDGGDGMYSWGGNSGWEYYTKRLPVSSSWNKLTVAYDHGTGWSRVDVKVTDSNGNVTNIISSTNNSKDYGNLGRFVIGVGGQYNNTGSWTIDNVSFSGETTPQAQPVAYYSFDNTSNPGHDDSGNGHNLTMSGPWSIVPGFLGKSLRTEISNTRGSYVSTSGMNYPSQNGFSVEYRLKVGSSTDAMVVRDYWEGRDSGETFGLRYYPNQSKADFFIRYNFSNPTIIEAPVTTQSGTWVRLLGVYDPVGYKIRLYVNDELKNETDMPAPMRTQIAPYIFVNGSPYGTNSGIIDEVKVYDCAITPAEPPIIVPKPKLTLGSIGSTKAFLRWTPVVDNDDYTYKVYVWTNTYILGTASGWSGPTIIDNIEGKMIRSSGAIISDLEKSNANLQYKYRFGVTAINSHGSESEMSNKVEGYTNEQPSIKTPLSPIVLVPGVGSQIGEQKHFDELKQYFSEIGWSSAPEATVSYKNDFICVDYVKGAIPLDVKWEGSYIPNVENYNVFTFVPFVPDWTDPTDNETAHEIGIEQKGIELGYFLQQLCNTKVQLVGHSLGGLTCRAYLQRIVEPMKYQNNVSRLVTTGTPHNGVISDYTDYYKEKDPSTHGVKNILLNCYLKEEDRKDIFKDTATWHWDIVTVDGIWLLSPSYSTWDDVRIEKYMHSLIDYLEQGVLGIGNKWDFDGPTLMEDVLHNSTFLKNLNTNESDTQFGDLPKIDRYVSLKGSFNSSTHVLDWRQNVLPFSLFFTNWDLWYPGFNNFYLKYTDGDGIISIDSQNLSLLYPTRKIKAITRNDINHVSEESDHIGILMGLGYPVLSVQLNCPANLKVTAPSGQYIAKDDIAMFLATYREIEDDNSPTSHKLVEIPFPEEGDYKIEVIPDPNADLDDVYSLIVTRGETSTVLAENVRIADIPEEPYLVTGNTEPIADAGEDQTVEFDNSAGAEVQLDGSGSVDPDGDELSYEWSWEGGSASGVNPTVTLPMGLTTVTLTVSDGLLSSTDTADMNVVDTTGPMVAVEFPTENIAVQDNVTLLAEANDLSEIAGVSFSLREDDGGEGLPAGFEDLAATWNDVSGIWEFVFDSTQLPDGYYVVFARAVDEYGNEGISEVVPFSIRNWAILPMLPATPNSKAGRTMPVKFSLRMAESVDPAMPFVYNDELEIRIYDMAEPGVILQSAVFGSGSRNYRIDMAGEKYMTNFKTKSSPATYVVEVWRPAKNFLVGSFTFKTVK